MDKDAKFLVEALVNISTYGLPEGTPEDKVFSILAELYEDFKKRATIEELEEFRILLHKAFPAITKALIEVSTSPSADSSTIDSAKEVLSKISAITGRSN